MVGSTRLHVSIVLVAIFLLSVSSVIGVQQAQACGCHHGHHGGGGGQVGGSSGGGPVKTAHGSEENREPPNLGKEYFYGIDIYYKDGLQVNGKNYLLNYTNAIPALKLIPDQKTNYTLKIMMPYGDMNEFKHADLTIGSDNIIWDKTDGITYPKNKHFASVHVTKKQDANFIYVTFDFVPTSHADSNHIKIRLWDTKFASNEFNISTITKNKK